MSTHKHIGTSNLRRANYQGPTQDRVPRKGIDELTNVLILFSWTYCRWTDGIICWINHDHRNSMSTKCISISALKHIVSCCPSISHSANVSHSSAEINLVNRFLFFVEVSRDRIKEPHQANPSAALLECHGSVRKRW